MAKDVKTIIKEIEHYLINKCGRGIYSDYYAGITKNIENRLFGDHNVPKEGYCWIYIKANDDEDARAIEKHFLDQGMKGGGGGGDEESVYVYVYKISSTTEE